MNGFVGCIERDAGAWSAVSGWMSQWLGIEPRKDSYALETMPFRFLGSREEGADDPAAQDEHGLSLTFRGFIAGDQLERPGGSPPTTNTEVAVALLERYREGGAESLAALNGRYVVIVWDSSRQTLELMNDPLGLKPVFLWHSGGSFALASNVWAIACHPRFRKDIDVRGMIDLLLMSHQQGNRTIFKDVSVLPPGSVTRFENGAFTSTQVRTLIFTEERWEYSLERAAHEMHALLERSVARRVPQDSPVLLPLSGGYDSRVLLGYLVARPADVIAVTQCMAGLYLDDARFARRMARCTGVPLKFLSLGYGHLAQYREKSVAIGGGMYDIHTGRMLSLMEHPQGGRRPIISGHLGGELTNRFLMSDMDFSSPEEHHEKCFRTATEGRFSPEMVRAMLDGADDPELADEVLAENQALFLSFDGPHFQQQQHWDLMGDRRRYICYLLLFSEQFGAVRAPFYDRDFVDFTCSLPFAALHGQQAYKEMMRAHLPALARIPNTNDYLVAISTKEVVRDFLNSQYKRFIQGPLHRALRIKGRTRIGPKQYGIALRTESRGVLDHIRASRERLSPYLNPHAVEEAMADLLAGDDSHFFGFLGLSAFATALEMVEDPHRAIQCWRGGPGAATSEPATRT